MNSRLKSLLLLLADNGIVVREEYRNLLSSSTKLKTNTYSADKSTPYCLLSTLFTMFKQTFLDVIIPRLVLIAFLISQAPYFQRLLLFLEHDDDSYSSKAKFIAGVVFIYLGITVRSHCTLHFIFSS